jgi:hypothetical protein
VKVNIRATSIVPHESLPCCDYRVSIDVAIGQLENRVCSHVVVVIFHIDSQMGHSASTLLPVPFSEHAVQRGWHLTPFAYTF